MDYVKTNFIDILHVLYPTITAIAVKTNDIDFNWILRWETSDATPQPDEQTLYTALTTPGTPEFEIVKRQMWLDGRADIQNTVRGVYNTVVLPETDTYYQDYHTELIEWYRDWKQDSQAPIPDFCQIEWDENWSNFVNGGYALVDSLVLEDTRAVIVYRCVDAVGLTKINAIRANTARWMRKTGQPRINKGLIDLREWDNYGADPLGSYAARIEIVRSAVESQINGWYDNDYLVNELPARETEFNLIRES